MLDIIHTYPYLIAILTFLIGFSLMPSVLKYAKKYNMVVRPNKRTSHEGSVPNIGGVNIFTSLLTVFIPMLIMGQMNPAFFIGICIIFIIGFIDDRLVLSAYWKIVGESLCAFFLIYFADIRVTSFYGVLGVYELHPLISYIFSYLCYMLIVNALNLIDGVDGLASGLGILYCLFFGIWFYFMNMSYYSFVCFAIVGALFVFFLFNVFGRSKRKIFMGDSGALILGYIITSIVFIFLETNKNPISNTVLYFPNAPVSVLTIIFIPIFDVFRVAITRLKNRKSVLEADRNHIHHLLLSLNFSHKQVTAILLSVTLLYFFIAIILKTYNLWVQLAIIILLGCLMIFIIWQFINLKTHKKQNESK
ncbi:hypothetical protein HW49_01195 [Porphyromonadaceae bacterium COT-184 OH4590]|nr:hypothetical protein HW49_01195 [Porphyromonadaceae bacterium COT-184 OH4590]